MRTPDRNLNAAIHHGVLLALYREARAGIRAAMIAGELKCSEESVAAAVDVLRERGCAIDDAGGLLFLRQTGLPCWADILESARQRNRPRLLGTRPVVYASTASTNDLCWSIVGSPDNAPAHRGLVVLADHQTAGRGRRGNTWVAGPGQSVLMSVLVYSDEFIENVTLKAGLAAAVGIEKSLGVGTQIKWPNDVLIDEKKIAGVLVEGRNIGNFNALVIGIGVNAAQGRDDFPPELRSRATSGLLASGAAPDRIRIVDEILAALDAVIDAPGEEGWEQQWKRRCQMFGKRYRFESAGRQFDAEVVDVDPRQGLVVRDDAGAMRFLPAATTTLSV